MGEALINLNRSIVFDRVDQQYLEVILVAAGFDRLFRGWITAMYICSVVKVNGH